MWWQASPAPGRQIGATTEPAPREAILHKVELSGAAFDLIVALPKADGVIYDLAELPEALLVHLIELALGFDNEEKMLRAVPQSRASARTGDGVSGRTTTFVSP